MRMSFLKQAPIFCGGVGVGLETRVNFAFVDGGWKTKAVEQRGGPTAFVYASVATAKGDQGRKPDITVDCLSVLRAVQIARDPFSC